MKHYCDKWIEDWCRENGWTEVFIERPNSYWAFPPGAVMPEPIPVHVLETIKFEKGWCLEERIWSILAVASTIIASILSFCFKCPIPMVFAFAFSAVTVAQLEVEYY